MKRERDMAHQNQTESLHRIELIISRIVDSAASEADWREFRVAAGADESLWQRLAEEQACQRALVGAVEPIAEEAAAVALPIVIREQSTGAGGIVRWPAWAGWAVAALLAVMWWTQGGWMPIASRDGSTEPVQRAGFPLTDWAGVSQVQVAPGDLLESYLQSGHVVGQGALQAIDLMETEQGTQVLIMRPIYERVQLEPKYLLPLNEQGEVVPTRVRRSPADLVNHAL